MPLIANVDGVRTTALRDGSRRGQCLDCGHEMLAKTGEVITWHWAHRQAEDAPACSAEPETEWHLTWKARCDDPARIEVAIGSRRADVLTQYRWAVEFQHSSLEVGEIRARERDWRQRLIWVIDGTTAHAEARLRTWRPSGREHWTVEWAWSPAWVREVRCRTFLDLGEGQLMLLGRWFEKDPDRPVMGYGWRVTADEVARCVLNGRRPPTQPRKGQPVDPESWFQPLHLVDCPDCGGSLHGGPKRRCAAANFHQGFAA